MRNINTYIIEKLHLNKDTKIGSNLLSIVLNIVGEDHLDSKHENELEQLFDELGVTEIEDFSEILLDDKKFMDNCGSYNKYTKKYAKVDNVRILHICDNYERKKIITNPWYYVYRVEEKRGKLVGFIFGYGEGSKSYNILFMK